jgi:toxin ParE1/3/4
MRLRVLAEAREELRHARRRYYREAGAKVSARFIAEFQRVSRLIAADPMRWPEIELDARRVRFRDRFPYSLVYLVRGDSVVILAVMHQHRDPGYWRSRTSSDR